MKIYVLHYSKLTQRKEHILEEFRKHDIQEFEFIEKFDKDEITEAECTEFHKDYIMNKRSELSLHLKHFYVYRLMIIQNIDEAIIFEDDIILSDGFINKLTKYMKQLPNNYDMLFIGDGCNLHIPNKLLVPNKYIYEKNVDINNDSVGATRCTDSYIIHNRCARKICDYTSNLNNNINLPIDWWLNIAARDIRLTIYWAEPTIVTQGSQNGLFSRSIISNYTDTNKPSQSTPPATNHTPNAANNLFALDGLMNRRRD